MRSAKFLQFMNSADAATRRLFRDQSGNPVSKAPEAGDLRAEMKETDSKLEIVLHDAIGDWWAGTDSATLVKAVKACKGKNKEIDLDINSFGGDAYTGIAFYNALADHDAKVTARITGIAYSAASVFPMAADEILISENATLGIHPAWLYTVGNRFALRDSAQWLETLDGQLVDTYAARTGRDKAEILNWFVGNNHDGTVFSGKQAVEYGFADAVIPLKKRKDGDADDPMSIETSADGKPSATVAEMRQRFEARHASALRREQLNAMRERLKLN